MTDKELVERLRKMLPPKVLYGDLIGAEGVYAHSGPLVWEDMESYVISEAADRIEQLRAELTNERIDNTNLIGELATVAAERDRYKAERDAAVNDLKYAVSFYTECFFCKYETDEGSTRCGKKDCWEWRGLEGNT